MAARRLQDEKMVKFPAKMAAEALPGQFRPFFGRFSPALPFRTEK